MQPDLFPGSFPLPEVIVHDGDLAHVSAMLDAVEAAEAASMFKAGDPVLVWVDSWPVPADVVSLCGSQVVVDLFGGRRASFHFCNVTPRGLQ